jgi:tRNA1Val (adenine37-N6)-methyltransferase
MQYTDDTMLRDDVRILQPADGYRFTLDAVLLATFVKAKRGDVMLEIGAGSGVVSILIARTQQYHSIAAVEIQKELAELCEKNFEINKLHNAVVYTEDVKSSDQLFPREFFDLIYCNPPYRRIGTGRLNPSTQKAVARHEIKMTLKDVFACADRSLKVDGHLTLILPTFRERDMHLLSERYKFHQHQRRYVHSFANESPVFILTTFSKSERPLDNLARLVIYEKPGEYTDELKKLMLG